MNNARTAVVLLALALLGVAVGGVLAARALVSHPDAPTRYTVVRGDTLSKIAADQGVTVDELRKWNHLSGDLIEVGQVLLVWTTASSAAPAAGPRRDRALSRGGTADRPRLKLPPELPCLAGPTLDGTADEAMAASEGLSHEQVSAAMNGFLPEVLTCLEGVDPAPVDALRLDILVGCNGRVADVRIEAAGDWSPEVATCVTGVLRYAPFPAHGLPDGDRFVFPLRYTAP